MTYTYPYFTLYSNYTHFFTAKSGKKYPSVIMCWTFILITWLTLKTVLRKDWLKCFKDERTAYLHILLHSWHYYKLKPEVNISSVELESELRNFLAVDFLHFYRKLQPWGDEITLNATRRECHSVSSDFLVGKNKRVICGLSHL